MEKRRIASVRAHNACMMLSAVVSFAIRQSGRYPRTLIAFVVVREGTNDAAFATKTKTKKKKREERTTDAASKKRLSSREQRRLRCLLLLLLLLALRLCR
jgi:hypothetical protein